MSRPTISRKQTKTQTVLTAENINKEEVARADFQKALLYQEKIMLHEMKTNTYTKEVMQVPYSLCVDDVQLGHYGTGLRLFFDFTQRLAIVFFIMSLITIPSINSNLKGNGIDQTDPRVNRFSLFSLANQPQIVLTLPSSSSTADQIAATQTSNKKAIDAYVQDQAEQQQYLVYPDLVYSILFVLFIIYYSRRQERLISQVKQVSILPSNYTVEVYNFPRTVISESAIQIHFQQFGKLKECQIARDYNGTLFLHRKEAELLFKIKVQENRIKENPKLSQNHMKQLEQELQFTQQELDEIISEKMGQHVRHNEYPSIKAFVVFESIKQRNKCIKVYKRLNNYCCFKPDWPQNLKLLGLHEIRVKPCSDQPSNIKWENQDVQGNQRCWRAAVAIFFVILLMLITFAIVFVANIVQPTNSQYCPKDSTLTLSEAKAFKNAEITDCWCQKQSVDDLLNNQEIRTFCEDYFYRSSATFGLTIATGFVVLFVNFLLKSLLNKLGDFSRYPTVSQKTVDTTLQLTVVMFINTAILTLILQADIFGFKPAIIASEPIPPLQALQQTRTNQFSPDFDRNWYIDIGSKMTTTMMIAILNPHATFLVILPLIRWNRNRKAKNASIQRDMNNFITGPPYDLTQYYALVLNTVFVCLFYSSGMPILIPFCFVTLTIQYWCFQYFLLRYNRRPPSYDHVLSSKSLQMLPWAVLFHLAIGVYMYGSPMIFPDSSDQISSEVNKSLSDKGIPTLTGIGGNSKQVNDIMSRAYNSLPLSILFLAILAYLLADLTLFQFIKNCAENQNKAASIVPASQQVSNKRTFSEEEEKMKSQMLSSYDIQNNDDYRDIILAIQSEFDDEDQTLGYQNQTTYQRQDIYQMNKLVVK